jgi:hypothetical protein
LGSPNYGIVTLQLRLSYKMGGPQAENIGYRAWRGLLGCLLDSWASTCLVPGTAFGATTTLLSFT